MTLLVLGGLRTIGHLLLHDELLSEGLDLSLENEVLLYGVWIGVIALLLALLASLALLLASHL